MIKFKKLGFEDASLLRKYYDSCPYESCEYSAGIKLFWKDFYPYEYAVSCEGKNESAGALIVKYSDGHDTIFEMPVLSEYDFAESDRIAIEKALDEIDDYCKLNEIVPIFSDVPRDMLSIFTERYNYLKIENYRTACDYVYSAENLKFFKGRHYAGQRNHINKFKSLYSDWCFRKLSSGEDLTEFWNEYYSLAGELSSSAAQEKSVAIAEVKDFDKCLGLFVGAIEVAGKIAAVSVGEICGDTIIIHIEKALTSYEGIYPLMVSEFLKAFASDEILWVNREEDDSDRGLRISKLQYRPDRLVCKSVVLPHSELLYVPEIPCLKTDRLTLDEIREDDAGEYQRLCLDEERNKLWGYDYREDLEEEYKDALPSDYFYQVAKGDFERRMCINFAIRLGEKFIGEVVIYQADLKGSAEMGSRILTEYAGQGYGREAFAKAADWAIYGAGLRQITAKCFKENTASFNMLSSCMKKAAEDDKYFYFVKTV